VKVPRAIQTAESAVRGGIEFQKLSATEIEVSLPLENNDFVALRY
jgi:hypothetical protein